MKLAAYLAQPGVTASALAAKCGVAVSTITRLARSEKGATIRLLRRIALHTDGLVAPNDFLEPDTPRQLQDEEPARQEAA